MARHEDWREKSAAIALVVLLHAAIGWWIEHARPDVATISVDDDTALQVDYITRPRANAGPRARSHRRLVRAFGDLKHDAADRAATAHAANASTATSAMAASGREAFENPRLLL